MFWNPVSADPGSPVDTPYGLKQQHVHYHKTPLYDDEVDDDDELIMMVMISIQLQQRPACIAYMSDL